MLEKEKLLLLFSFFCFSSETDQETYQPLKDLNLGNKVKKIKRWKKNDSNSVVKHLIWDMEIKRNYDRFKLKISIINS